MQSFRLPAHRAAGRRKAAAQHLLRAMWRVMWRAAYGIYAWTVFTLLMSVFGGMAVLLRRPAASRPVMRAGARLLLRLCAIRARVKGLERLPAGPHVLALNHASFLDGIALTALLPAHPGYAFVVRQQYRMQSLLCPLLRALGAVVLSPAHAHAPGRDIARMAERLSAGERLLVFPEGGFRREAGLDVFHSGALVAASDAGVPVVAAGLRGTRSALPLHTWLPRRHALRLVIGAAWQPRGDAAALRGLSAELRHAVARLCGEARCRPRQP